jgi:hypothetical protein
MNPVLRLKARRLARSVLPATCLLALVSAVAPTSTGRAAQPAGPAALPAAPDVVGEAVAGARPEVRLRKLHLVRPDLIPYPIAYDVYC